MKLRRNLSACAGVIVVMAMFDGSPRPAMAQGASPQTMRAAAPALVEYFKGAWHCDGAFSNGRPISATMEFADLLDGAWVTMTHHDVPPSSHHAFSIWGVAPTGGMLSIIADNRGGMRRFVAPRAGIRTASRSFVIPRRSLDAGPSDSRTPPTPPARFA